MNLSSVQIFTGAKPRKNGAKITKLGAGHCAAEHQLAQFINYEVDDIQDSTWSRLLSGYRPATLVMTKGSDHAVSRIRLRKL